jgi:hypothetical protein
VLLRQTAFMPPVHRCPRAALESSVANAMSRQTATLALLAFAMLIVSLDQYIVVVALPEIGRELGYS